MSFKLEIISPQDKIFDDEVDLCIMPGIEGDFGVLRNHMPFLTTLRLGIAYIYKEKKLIETYLVNGGVVEVSKNHCTLLTEDIINSNDFKVEKNGIVHVSIGKVSFDSQKIYENAKEVIQHIIKIKPSSSKGNYLKSISMSSTMSPGIKVDTNI